MVTQLPQELFEFLTNFQRRLCQVIRSVGKIEHSQWRSFTNERKTELMEVSIEFRTNCIDVPISFLIQNLKGQFICKLLQTGLC